MTKDDFIWLFNNVRDAGEPEGYSVGKEQNGMLFIIDENCGIKYRLEKGEVKEMQVDSMKEFQFENIIEQCNYAQLQKLTEMCKAEMSKRDAKRFDELVKNVLDAVHALKTEYPFATWNITIDDADCGSLDVDLLDISHSTNDFCM